MPGINVVKRNFFRDSLQLMRLTEDAKKLAGVEDAVIAMGTETNKRLLRDLDLLGAEGEAAHEGDLILAVLLSKGAEVDAIVKRVEEMVLSPPSSRPRSRGSTFHSIESALDGLPGANLAVISVPGNLAFEPSMALLRRGVNVHLFSDHVTRAEESELKSYASSKGLLVLGPGAGTSMINGVGLGFANAVRRGSVGIVASAGTGIQEVSVLLDRTGLGVSQALGVGGSDVSDEIGGLMMKDCLGLLNRDDATEVLMIVAKAPTQRVTSGVMDFVSTAVQKPVVACFLGMDMPPGRGTGIRYAKTLHSAVAEVTKIIGKRAGEEFNLHVAVSKEDLLSMAGELSSKLGPGQTNVRGLYSGGTLAHETLLILKLLIGESFSNTPLSPEWRLKDPGTSIGNAVVDLGDEFFTEGRAHPMIDPTLRRLRILQEANDPTVAVIMLDIVLGYGSSADPGGALTGAISEAKSRAKGRGRELVVMAHVCGTDSDPQSLEEQSAKLANAGVILFASNAQMAVAAALVVGGDDAKTKVERNWGDLFG